MKSLCFTEEQGNYAFLAANLNKLRSNEILSNSVWNNSIKIKSSQVQIKICGL